MPVLRIVRNILKRRAKKEVHFEPSPQIFLREEFDRLLSENGGLEGKWKHPDKAEMAGQNGENSS
jgi:hypothetical protein